MTQPVSSIARSVAIVGGGPAGLMAATKLVEAGVGVTIYEHRRSMGRKFLLAGRGGLNITHSEPIEKLLARYGNGSDQIQASISGFAPHELRAWCAEHAEPTFVGTSGRVFPASFRATPLLRSWLQSLSAAGVEFKTSHTWTGWTDEGDLEFLRTDQSADNNSGSTVCVTPDATVFALGGASWPRVGSDGAWVTLFRDAGVAVEPLSAANCGVLISWSRVIRDRFAGTPLKNVNFAVSGVTVRGDAVLTNSGLEGGPIYAHSRALREQMAQGQAASLYLDLSPDLDVDALEARLAKRRPKSSIASWLGSAGVSPLSASLLREVTGNEIPNDAREVAELVKRLPLTVDGLAPIDRAISSAGGVRFSEVDEHFMLIHLPGTFVAGEMLDWDAPTGGYLLQACFSTGAAAAAGVLARFA